MRILFATMQFGLGYSQGTERYLGLLIRELQRRGHECAVLAGDPERRGPRLQLGAHVADSPPTLAMPSRGWMSVRGIEGAPLRDFLRAHRPDLMHLVNPGHIGVGIGRAARERQIPVVATMVDFWWLCPKHTLLRADATICSGRRPARECLACIAADRRDSRRATLAQSPVGGSRLLPLLYAGRWWLNGVPPREIAAWMNRVAVLREELARLNGVIFLSNAARTRFAPLPPRLPTTVIYNGLEDEWFTAASNAPPPTTSPGDMLTLGYAGALAPHKGVHLMLQALRELNWSDVQLRIAGGGEPKYLAQLQALAAGLDVEFVGRVAPAQMPVFLQSLDALIVPSIWIENLPMIVFEALACGAEVLGSAVDGVAEILGDPQRLFEPNSVPSLVARLRAWRAARPARSTTRVRRAAEMASDTEAFYTRVLNQQLRP